MNNGLDCLESGFFFGAQTLDFTSLSILSHQVISSCTPTCVYLAQVSFFKFLP